MRRSALIGLALVLCAGSARAEVSVVHGMDGTTTPFFQPGTAGPWDAVRSGVPVADLLNRHGDGNGDGWPVLTVNAGTDAPEVAWSTGGDNREIRLSAYDGSAWTLPLNLSSHPAADELPALCSDSWGNRFAAWERTHRSKSAVIFTVVTKDGHRFENVSISDKLRDGRRPSVGVAPDASIIAAYGERTAMPGSPTLLAIDRIEITRDVEGRAADSGESPIDVARQLTLITRQVTATATLEVRVHVAAGHLWVTWLDSNDEVGYVEYVDGMFTEPMRVGFDEPGGDDAAREEIQEIILGP